MKILLVSFILQAAKGACADSGVNEPSIYEISTCERCRGDCTTEGTFIVREAGDDCDNTPSTQTHFGVNYLTPVDSSCSTTSYVISQTPYTYTPHPQAGANGCTVSTSTKFCVKLPPDTTIAYWNQQPFSVQFYYCAVFNDGSRYCHPQVVGISVLCPAGPLQYTTTVSSTDFIFQQNTPKVIDFASQIQPLFQTTDACPGVLLTSYEVYTDSGLTSLFADDGTFQLANPQESIITKMTITSTTPLNFQTFYVIAASKAFAKSQSQVLAINIYICGFESIQFTTAPAPITATFFPGTGVQTLDHSAQSGLLSSSFASCPINKYEVITDQTTGAVLSGTSVTVDATNLQVDTLQPVSSPLWLRVSTSSIGVFYDIPLNIDIQCGSETIQFSPSAPIVTEIYDKATGSHMLDFQSQASLLSSSQPACPIQTYDITTDQAGTLYTGSQIQLASQNVITDTTTAFNTPLFIRASTIGGASYYIPLNIYVCGFETIIASPTSPTILIQTYANGIGNQNLDHTTQTSLLSSSHSVCPIQTREIITDQALGTSLGGFPVSVDATNIITDTSTGFNTPLWLRSYTRGGAYYDIPLTIIVCGFETIQATSPTTSFDITYQRLSVIENLDHTFQTSLLSSSYAGCPIQSYDIITDQVAGTSLGGTPISVDSTNIITDTQSPFSTPLWLRTYTIGGVFYDIPLNIYICGFETIITSSTPSALGATYQKGIGSQSLDHTSQTNHLSSSHAGCPIQSYDIITDQAAGTSLGGTPVSVDLSSVMTDTIASFSTPLWLRSFTSGGVFYDIPLNIYVCGFETITASSTPVISINYKNGMGIQTLDHTAQTGLLSSSHALCPITHSEIITDTVLGTLLGGTPISHDATNIYVDTTNAFNTPIWLRTYTSGGNFYDFPLQINVCGFETILIPGATPTSIEITYQRNSLTELLDHTFQTNLLTSSSASCPIQIFEIITDQALGTSLGGSTISVDSTNIVTQTSTAFNTPLWLRASTSGGAFYDIPLNIYICGFETVTYTTAPAPIQITYQRDSVPQTLDHTPHTSLLSSSHFGCPIQSYEVITDQIAGTSLGGSPITVDSTNILTQTLSPFNTPLWLRTFTSGGAFYDIPLKIYICGFEKIIASSPITSIFATYQENTGIYSTLDHSAQTNLLSSSWSDCPIIADKQIILTTTSTVITGAQFSADATNIITDSINAFNQPLSLRILTSGGSYFDIPLDIVVCDDALIGSVDSSVIIKQTYVLNSGIQNYDVKQIQEAIRPSANRCPLVKFDIVDNSFAPFANPKLQLVANFIQSDTSEQVAVNQEKYYLRAHMDGSTIEKHVPIDFHFCGAEAVIFEGNSDSVDIVFSIGQGVVSYDISKVMQKLHSTDPKCPVVKYELYDKDKQQVFKGPQNVQLQKNSLLVETQTEFKLILQLRASTKYGRIPNFLPLSVEVQQTQSSCQPPNLDLIKLNCTPNSVMHPDLLSFASKAQYELGAKLLDDQLLNLLNLDSDLIGKNTSLKNDMSTAIFLEVQPPLGKQIIKFDTASQSIDVSSYDERFAGIYKCSLTVVSEGRIRTVNFEINLTSLNFKVDIADQNIEEIQEQIQQFSSPNSDIKKFFAKITKINKHGEVSIKFSEPLNNPNITLFNQSMNLFIQPAPLTYDALENQDPKAIYKKIEERRLIQSSEFLNFTWKSINMTDLELDLKINFEYPFNVSTSDNLRDQLVIQIEDPLQFRSKKLSYLDEGLMIWPIRRQFPDDDLLQEYMDSIEIFTDGLQYSTIFTFITNLFVMLWLNHIAQAFQHLNIILAMTMINIQSPSNVIFFLTSIKQITNAEILQSQFTTELILNFENEDELMSKIKQKDDRDNLLNDHLIDMGYENFSPTQNLGGIIFSFVLYIILLVSGFVIKIVKICLEKFFPKFKQKAIKKINQDQDLIIKQTAKMDEEIKERTQKALEQKRMRSQESFEGGEIIIKTQRQRLKLEKKRIQEQREDRKRIWRFYIKLTYLSNRISELLMFQYMFTLVTESFTTLLISGILWWDRVHLARKYLQEDYDDNLAEKINDVVGALLILLVSAITIIYFLMISVISLDRVNSVTFKQYVGFMLERLMIENRLQLLYNFWYTLRRLLIVLIALFLENHTGIQLILFMLLNLSSLVYIGLVRPFKGKTLNQNELLSEFSTSIITIIEVCFTQFSPDPQNQFSIGWVFISAIILCIIYFQAFIFKQILRYARLLCLRKCLGEKSSQNENNKQEKQEEAKEVQQNKQHDVINILDNNKEQANDKGQQNQENNVTFGDQIMIQDQEQMIEQPERLPKKINKMNSKEQIHESIFDSKDKNEHHSRNQNNDKVIKQSQDDKEFFQVKKIYDNMYFKLHIYSLEQLEFNMVMLKSIEENTQNKRLKQYAQQFYQRFQEQVIIKKRAEKLEQKRNHQKEENQSSNQVKIKMSEKIPNQVFSSSSSERQIYQQSQRHGQNIHTFLDELIQDEKSQIYQQNKEIKNYSKPDQEEDKQEDWKDSDSSGEIIPENEEIKKWLFNETLGRSEMPQFCKIDIYSYPPRPKVDKEMIKHCIPPFKNDIQNSIGVIDFFLGNEIMTDMQRLYLKDLREIYKEQLKRKRI